MDSLRDYQQNAVKEIYNFFNSDDRKAKIYLPTGLGITTVIVSAVQLILQNNKGSSVLIVSANSMICKQMYNVFTNSSVNDKVIVNLQDFKKHKILITTYQEIIKEKFDLGLVDMIICNDTQVLKNNSYFSLWTGTQTKFLGILRGNESSNEWFSDARCLFSYTVSEALNDGYNIVFSEKDFIQQFMILLLKKYGYKHISQEVEFKNTVDFRNKGSKSCRVDIVAEQGTNNFIIEVKLFRNLNVSQTIINSAVRQILTYKEHILQDIKDENKYKFILVLPCKVDDILQDECFKKEKIIIWDIYNLLYMCDKDEELSNLLYKYIPYSLTGLKPQKPHYLPIYLENINGEKNNNIFSSEGNLYIDRLQSCKLGKESYKEYERICTDIIKYLFDSEFYKLSEQHKTGDEMYRMDLVCSLKGTTEFWKFLIDFYHTRFVVFEYKNYSKKISQNLIYITEKYLFPAVLRNVAFIISRKGFDSNAQNAALGCLRENGKLIISVDEDDLINMIYLKENGEEPSDYLLDKVEDLLMSVSK